VNLPELSIRRPVFALMLTVGLVVLGAVSATKLEMKLDPDMEFPIVYILTELRGASPVTVESEVSDVLEEHINSVEGIRSLSSVSSEGLSRVTVEFGGDYEIDVKLQEVRDKVALARPSLPIDGDFNLSHSDGVVVCALSPTDRIGIDIEPIDRFPVRDIDQVLGDGERAAIDRAADPAREWCRVWTFKEAVIKADGRGVAAGLERIDSHSSTVKLDGESWHVQPVALHSEFCCHLASGSSPIEVDVHEIMLDALLESG